MALGVLPDGGPVAHLAQLNFRSSPRFSNVCRRNENCLSTRTTMPILRPHDPVRFALCLVATLTALTGCGSDDNDSTPTVAMHTPCPHSCPVAYVHITLDVAAENGDAIGGVEATFSGPATGTLSCDVDQNTTVCRWPAMDVSAGSYSLHVTAPGFQAEDVSAAVSITHDCGCDLPSLTPSTMKIPRFRGHPKWRENAPGVDHGDKETEAEAASVLA
jgi:hypothetical protein